MGGRVLHVEGEEFYNAGVEYGLERGIKQGRSEGRSEERKVIMDRLIAGGIPTQEAARYVGLTV